LYVRHNSIKPIAHKENGAWVNRWARLRESQKGAPDIIVFLPPRNGYLDGRAVAIEVKGGKGKQSPEQELWEIRARRNGIKYVVAKTLEDVLGVIK
jgi:hypothetical protein